MQSNEEGVADYLRFAMIDDGLSEKEARARFWVIPEFSQEKGRQTVAESQWTPEYSAYTV
jgi:hypothetical protein